MDRLSKRGHMYKWHDGIYMLHEKVDACRNQMEVAGTCWSELVRCEKTVRFVEAGDI